MNYSVKVSVIVPVYNTEKYLKQCLNSILNQTLQNIELICVDDESTDSSLEILKKYKERDNRVHILQQKNKGAGAARNYAMKFAHGEYLIFLDSDDFFEPEMLEKAVKKCEKDLSDICIFGSQNYIEESGNTSPSFFLKEKFIPKSESFVPLKFNYLFNIVTPHPWNKLIKHQIITDNHLSFMEIPRTNDYYFIYMTMLCAKKISICKEIFVNYRIHDNSLQQTNSTSPLSFYEAYKALYNSLNEKGLFTGNIKNSFFNNILSGGYYNLYSQKNDKSFFEILNIIRTDYFPKLGFDNFNDVQALDNEYEKYLEELSLIKNGKIEVLLKNKQQDINRLIESKNIEINKLKNTITWKIGSLITFFPKKIIKKLPKISKI